MAEIGYKTRGKASPTGKPRVWFCAHPGDYEAFFEHTTHLILEKQNCAIYYDKTPTAPYEKEVFLSDLSSMNLFVMPVTTRLLLEENRALNTEFRYALEHHIPVLPLMQERGLEELFNTKCGDLQFLDEHQQDATGISFDVKLERFLSAVLVGDALAEKVRRAFDAYIFLSYRKKDRKYAQELMRLIHKNEFCRDIAIWYDEFLVPGEDFNDSIRKAMQDSKLFALAVTPNLLEPGNYVMEVEYKQAREAHKPILAAEVVQTDRTGLAECFRDIPDAVDARDSAALSDALLQTLSDIAKRQNDDEPEHNFLIGLAYLSGIDVETDQQRALELIRFAADAQLPEAMDKLARMYRNGEGVQRDADSVIAWQSRLVALRQKNHASREISTGDYVRSLLQLAEDYGTFRQVKDAIEAYNGVIGIVLAERAADMVCIEALLTALERCGSLHMEQGDLSLALKLFRQHQEYVKQLPKETKERLSAHLIASSLCMGQLYSTMGELYMAEESYQEAGRLARKVQKAENTVAAARNLIGCYQKMTELFCAYGDMGEALGASELALELAEEIRQQEPGSATDREVMLCQLRRGEALLALQQEYQAEEAFQTAHVLAEELCRSGTYDDRRGLMLCHSALGQLAMHKGHGTAAKRLLGQARGTAQRLADEVSTSRAWLDLAEVNLSFAELYQSVFITDPQLARLMDPELADTEEVEMDADALNRCMDDSNRQSAAHCAEALRAVEAAATISMLPTVRQMLVQCHLRMGEVCRMDSDMEGARGHYQTAIDIQKALCKDASTPAHTYGLYEVYREMGEMQTSEMRRQKVEQDAQSEEIDTPAGLGDKIKQVFCKPKSGPYMKKAYCLIRKLKWNCPLIPAYRQACQELEEEMGIRSGLPFWPAVAVLVGTFALGISCYYYNYLGRPADLIYWLLASPGLWGMWGIIRIFEAKRFERYRRKVYKKGRKAKLDYFTKVCNDLQFGCMYIVLVSIAFVLLFSMIK